jgi:hypothetical protein
MQTRLDCGLSSWETGQGAHILRVDSRFYLCSLVGFRKWFSGLWATCLTENEEVSCARINSGVFPQVERLN